MKKLEELERKEKEEAARERAKQEMLIAEAKKAAEKKKEEEFKKKVIEEAEREKYAKELKEKKKKEEEDKMFKARLKEMYLAQGYSEESIEIMIKNAEHQRKHGSHSPHSPHGSHSPHGHHDGTIVRLTEQTKIMDLSRPTYIKVHRKHLSPDTLDAYDLPWEWDDVGSPFATIRERANSFSSHSQTAFCWLTYSSSLPARYQLHRHQKVDPGARPGYPVRAHKKDQGAAAFNEYHGGIEERAWKVEVGKGQESPSREVEEPFEILDVHMSTVRDSQ